MTFHSIFSPYIFQINLENNEHLKRKIIPYIKKAKRKKNSLVPSHWNCDVFSTYLNRDKEVELFGTNFDNSCLMNEYNKTVIKFFDKMQLIIPAFNIDLWYNVYSKNQYQEWHDHYGQSADFSAIHFLKYDPDKHSPIIFKNPTERGRLFSSFRNKQIIRSSGNIENMIYDRTYSPKVKEGDLIIFPSWLEHSVPPNKTNDLRATVSFNIELL